MRHFVSTICFLLLSLISFGSGISFSNLAWDGPDRIRVEVSWEYSWSLDTEPFNHDAAWIFAKYRTEGENNWSALKISGATTEAGFQTTVPFDQVGLFLERNVSGDGLVENVELEIELEEPVSGRVDLRIFGLEMVYIPEAPFWIGDGVSANTFTLPDGTPFLVDSENTIDDLDTAGVYAPKENIPASWPKGYNAFYVLKHEVSQAGYTAFLNTLEADAQNSRTALDGIWAFDGDNLYRNGIVVMQNATSSQPAVFAVDGNRNGIFNEADDGADRAVNGLGWDDVTAWLDWAGLRPLTEFEYEKMSRGTEIPVPGGFAWGTDLVSDANTIADDGMDSEHCSDLLAPGSGFASHGYLGPQGPLRNGFAANANSERLESGASYYGVLELSGNLWELCVGVHSPWFTGEHGNGELTSGASDEPDWPDAGGAGLRGGAWNSGIGPVGFFRDLAISDRWYAGLAPAERRFTIGIRGGRTAE